MKRTLHCIVIAGAIFLFTGCKATSFLFKEEVTQKEVVTEVQEVVEISPGVFETNLTSQTSWVPVTNIVANPALTTGIDLVTGIAPFPWAGAVGTGLSVLFGGIARFQTKKLRAKESEASEANSALESVVMSVEAGHEVIKEELERVKASGEKVDPGSIEGKFIKALKQTQKVTGHSDKIKTVIKAVRAFKK